MNSEKRKRCATPRRAVFLDRDGTLNRDDGYVHDAAHWHWLPGVIGAMARLKANGWLLVVVSNQSGIARGYFDPKALKRLEQWVDEELLPAGATPDAWYDCPHLPEITGPCECRKPKPGLLLQAAQDLGIDLAGSWMVGDRLRDVQAGLAAGCRTVLLSHRDCARALREAEEAEAAGVPVRPSLAEASALILREGR